MPKIAIQTVLKIVTFKSSKKCTCKRDLLYKKKATFPCGILNSVLDISTRPLAQASVKTVERIQIADQ